jgi:hypothetical protein
MNFSSSIYPLIREGQGKHLARLSSDSCLWITMDGMTGIGEDREGLL